MEITVDVQSNWWEHFFQGTAVDLWMQAVPAEHSMREADAIERLLEAAPGGALLDIPCGGGRLAHVFADRGYRVTGVDWSAEFLAHARAADTAQRVAWEQRDMRDLPWRARFDGAFCYGNSFGYLDDEGNASFLRAVSAALKPGARFVMETPMVLENLLAHIADRPWWKVGDMLLLGANEYDPARGRLDIAYTMIRDGRAETQHGTHRAYTYRQTIELFDSAGFDVTLAEPWRRDAHAVTFVGRKR